MDTFQERTNMQWTHSPSDSRNSSWTRKEEDDWNYSWARGQSSWKESYVQHRHSPVDVPADQGHSDWRWKERKENDWNYSSEIRSSWKGSTQHGDGSEECADGTHSDWTRCKEDQQDLGTDHWIWGETQDLKENDSETAKNSAQKKVLNFGGLFAHAVKKIHQHQHAAADKTDKYFSSASSVDPSPTPTLTATLTATPTAPNTDQTAHVAPVRPPQRRPELAVTGTPGRAERAPPLRVSPLEILFSSDENSGLDGFQPEGVDIGMLLDDAVFRVKANGMGDIWYLGYENPLEVLRLSGGALMSLEDWKLYVLQKAAAKRLPAQPIILVRIQDPEDPALVEFKNCTGSNQIRVACPTSRTDKHPEKEIIWDWRASTPQELHLNGFTGGHLSPF